MKNKSFFILSFVVLLFGLTSAEVLEYSFSKIKLNTLMQFWYQYDNAGIPKDTFYIRRAEIKLSGEIKSNVLWSIMLDPAQVREDDIKTKNVDQTKVVTSVGRKSILQDFIITLKPYKFCSIDFGQYKIPFGMEGLESSAKLDFVERSAMATVFKWTDYRDLGISLKCNFQIKNIEIYPQIGFFKGEGQNKLDVNESIDFAGRLVVKPIDQLYLGVAYYNGKNWKNEIENVRTGTEIKFVKEPFSVYSEYAFGKSNDKEKLTYYITFTYKFLKSFQLVARYDYYDPDTNTENDEKYDDTIGINYFIENHNAKIQFNYVYRGEKETEINDDVIRVNLQISY